MNGEGDQTKTGGGSGEESKDTIPKQEYEKTISEMERLKQELEDTKMEVMSPEYLEFLEARDRGSQKKEEKPTPTKDDLEKMTAAEAYAKAKAEAQAEIEKIRNEVQSSSKAMIDKEVREFGERHEDFELYRPTMYGLSTDPKNAGKSLTQLYNMAKEHHKKITPEVTEDQKKKSRNAGGEKPGGSSSSVGKQKEYKGANAAAEAALDAWDEVVGSDGLPPAV